MAGMNCPCCGDVRLTQTIKTVSVEENVETKVTAFICTNCATVFTVWE